MAISATYGELQRVVADELGNRTDLLSPLSDSSLSVSPIQYALQSAIAKHEREPFYFNEAYTQPLFTTVAGEEFYDSTDASTIATSPYLSSLHALISSTRYPIEKRSWQWIEEVSGNPSARGQPTDWAYLAQQVRLYPIPDGAYPIRATRAQRVAALSADGDSNVWTTDAFDLIRSEAKLILAREVLHDDEMAARIERAIYGPRGYLSALKGETTRRARSRVRPTSF